MDPAVELPAELADLLGLAREQVSEVAALDVAQAEAWASDLLALADELDDDGERRLLASLREPDDAVILEAIESLRSGTSRCDGAWELQGRGATSALLRFVDAADERHVVSVDLVPGGAGEPETVGEVVVGPADLVGVLAEEDARVESVEMAPASLARRIAAALAATASPTGSAVANGRLLAARLAPLTGERVMVLRPAPDVVPPVPDRDPDVDAWALDIVVRAFAAEDLDSSDLDVAAAAAESIAPSTLDPLGPAARDAVLTLEVADWLGAVLQLVREGPGASLDGEALVDAVNRCPEVASPIPKADRARIAWAFTVATEPWERLGLVDDGRLTRAGARILPRALRLALGG